MKPFIRSQIVKGLSLIAFVLCVTAMVVPVSHGAAPESQRRLLDAIKYLASDELEGRGVGSEGLNQAGEFIKQEFAKAGLDVTKVDGDAFQKFSMITSTKLGNPNSLEFVGVDGKTVKLESGKDFQTCSFGGSASFAGEVVFAGYAIDAPEAHYNDFKGIDVKGKIVIVMRRAPLQTDSDSPFAGPHGGISRHADLRTKVSNSFGAGAAAILFVNDPFTNNRNAETAMKRAKEQVILAAEKFDAADPKDGEKTAAARKKLSTTVKQLKDLRASQKKSIPDVLMKFGYGGNGTANTVPVLHITQAACDQLLKSSLKKSLSTLEAEIDKDLKSRSAVLQGWKVKGTATVTRVRTEVKNVIGVLEGEGPLADETIVIGAHYDHVGRGGPGSLARGSKEIHNGADDNASGTVSLLELARRLSSRKEQLPRRLVFIAFTAEELGLIGSARYVKEPVFPLEQTIAMYNMDMVGRLRDDKLTIFGTGTAAGFKGLLETMGKEHKLKLTMKPSGFGPSDQSSFVVKQIPVLHFFTGTHSDYHRPGDDWEKVNIAGMERVIGMIEQVVVDTAMQPKRPEYKEVQRKATANRGGNRPYFGSIPDFGSDAPGYAISGTAPGSPAAKGGLKGGDRIVLFGTTKIADLSDFDLALRKVEGGDTVEVTVIRAGKPVKLKVILDKPR